MKTMIWKEIRENIVWGAGALLIFSVAPLLMLSGQWIRIMDNRITYPLFGSDYSTFISYGAPLLGLLLGFVQIRAERSRDLRSFLMHRPLSFSQIFFAKIIAGTTILVVAFGLPLLAVHCWHAWIGVPGWLYSWRMALPPLNDLANGWICYLAALITTQRQARWYASRALSLATVALVVIATTSFCREFWQSLLVQVIVAPVLLLAAWGTFLADGEDAETPRWGYWGSLTVHFVGMTLVVGFVVMALSNALTHDYRRYANQTIYTLMEDGRIAQFVDEQGTGEREATWFDEPKGESFNPYTLGALPILTHGFPAPDVVSTPYSYRSYRYYFQPANWKNRRIVFDTFNRVIHVIDLTNGKHLGIIDQDGFHADTVTSVNPFPETLNSHFWTPNVFSSPHFIWRIDPETFAVEKVMEAKPGESWTSWPWDLRETDTRDKIRHFHVFGEKRYLIFDMLGNLLIEMPYSVNTENYMSVGAGWVPDRSQFFLRYYPKVDRRNPDAPTPGVPTLVWYSSDGTLAETRELPPDSRPRWVRSTVELVALTVSLPPVLSSTTTESADRRNPMFWFWILSVTLGCGGATFLLTRKARTKPAAQLGWTLLGMAGGLPGFLTMLSLRARMPLQTCNSCGQTSNVRDTHCSCGAPLIKQTTRDGTEVFEELVV